MARRHGPLFQPHYPRRNQYGPGFEVRGKSEEVWYPGSAEHSLDILKSESAVGVGELFGLGEHFAVGIDRDGGDLLLGNGTILRAGAGGGDGVHHVHAGRYLAEGGVLAVQVLGVGVHDEELAARGVGGGGTGHTENAPLMLQVVLHAVEEELALDAVARAAHSGALGAAALDHEAGDDPVEDQAVIVIVVTQVDEVVNALGGLVRVQLALDNAARLHRDLKSRIHLISLLHSPVDLALGIALRRGLSFVIELLALAQSHVHLHPAALEVDGQGDQGVAVLLDLAVEPHDLPLVHQEPAGAAGVYVEPVAMVVGGDVHLV